MGKWIWTALLISVSSLLYAQQDTTILFTYNGQPVTLQEFAYVFHKNNPDKSKPTLSQLEDYLELYINFKLKVAEAEAQQIDTLPQVKRDLTNYLDQLYRSYLDKILLDTLFKEAYHRMQTDVRTRHILVSLPKNPSPEDTLKAYRKAMQLRERILDGTPFSVVAREASDDDFSGKNGGDIGYITAFAVPFYNFESAVYNTPLGKVSLPVRTRLGYHLIMPVERRQAMGEVTLSHILLRIPENADAAQVNTIQRRADSIYRALQQGAPFDSLALRYSEDMVSRQQGGRMQPFGSGKMISAFDSMAYSLDLGEISRPFKTIYGYHIIRKEDVTPIPDSSTAREMLRQKLARDTRYAEARQALAHHYKTSYGFVSYPDRLSPVLPYIDSTLMAAQWENPGIAAEKDKSLFLLGDREYSISDFLSFIASRQVRKRDISKEELVQDYFDAFVDRKVLEYGLSKTFPDYPLLRQEYRDGILMFAMMDKKVWNKAVVDSAGLQAYYADNASNHMWQERVVADIFTISKRKAAEKLQKKATKWDNDKLLRKINKKYADSIPVVTLQTVTVEKNVNPYVDSTGWVIGVSPIYTTPDSTFKVVRIKERLTPMPKKLNEARGAYISDYQQYLDKKWIESLRRKYTIEVNTSYLQKLLP